ncbi:MAG: Fic family protein [Thermoleophilia bacterium]|nr:Fic family protein [Thermoleophilia bacterium]
MAGGGRYVERSWAPDFKRSGGRRQRAERYRAFVPTTIGEDEPALESATSALAERAGTAVRDLNADVSGLVSLEGLGRQLLRSEALASSQIEGLSVSHRKLAEAELAGRGTHHKAAEIVGAIRAMERAMTIGGEAGRIDVGTVTALHAELSTVPPLDRIAGQLREEASWIGGAAPATAEYVGPPHEEVEPLLRDLCEFMNRDDVSPVPQAAIAHAQFETIHPFGDGNGRVGRCLVHTLFWRRGLAPRYVPPISLVLGANKDAYVAGLEAYRAGRLDEWVRYFSRAVEVAAARAREFSAAVAALQENWRNRVRPVRRDSAVMPLIDLLPEYPVITAAVAEKEIGRSRPATLNGLTRLAEAGALKRHRNQKYGDSWEARELFTLLKRFEDTAHLPAS